MSLLSLFLAAPICAQVAENISNVTLGQRIVLSADVEGGQGPYRYQWYHNGAPIGGAGQATLELASIRAEDAGQYAVVVANDFGESASLPEIIHVVETLGQSRLANVSIVSSTGESLVVGFALGGEGTDGSSRVLARAAGPALLPLGVDRPLVDPTLSVFDRGTLIAANDDWGATDLLTRTAAAVGAFPFAQYSKDAAIVLDLARASYTAVIQDGSGARGATVMELYDTGSAARAPRLTNISARGTVGAGAGVLIAGFTVQGDAPLRVLIRGIGPGLADFNVTGALSSPHLALFRQNESIGTNDGWATAAVADIATAASAVGAFSLAEKSADTAMLVTLKPGSYTAQLSGAADSSGIGLIEIYEVP